MAKIKGKESGHQSLAKRARTPSLSSRLCQTCKSALGKVPPTGASTSLQRSFFGTSLTLKNRQIMLMIADSSGTRRDILFRLPSNNGILPNQGSQPQARDRAATPSTRREPFWRGDALNCLPHLTHGGPGSGCGLPSCCSHPRLVSLTHGPLLGTWRPLRTGRAHIPRPSLLPPPSPQPGLQGGADTSARPQRRAAGPGG